jgi:hypothetical protein
MQGTSVPIASAGMNSGGLNSTVRQLRTLAGAGWCPGRQVMFPPAMYPVPNLELYSATPWAQSSSLGASSIWSITMSNWMGPAGDSNILAADGNRALALPRFRLVAFPVILPTP